MDSTSNEGVEETTVNHFSQSHPGFTIKLPFIHRVLPYEKPHWVFVKVSIYIPQLLNGAYDAGADRGMISCFSRLGRGRNVPDVT